MIPVGSAGYAGGFPTFGGIAGKRPVPEVAVRPRARIPIVDIYERSGVSINSRQALKTEDHSVLVYDLLEGFLSPSQIGVLRKVTEICNAEVWGNNPLVMMQSLRDELGGNKPRDAAELREDLCSVPIGSFTKGLPEHE